MPLSGQSSGGWTESSSALRILHAGVRNTVGVLADDAFTQTNPPVVVATSTVSTTVDTEVLGVLSGSVAFTRPDAGGGDNFVGGNVETVGAAFEFFIVPLGIFINNAVGNAFENTPGPASGKGPYVCGQGTYASQLYETQFLDASGGGGAAGDDITYTTGMRLIASRNGYLMPQWDIVNAGTFANAGNCAEVEHGHAAGTETLMGVLKMVADATQAEIVFDQRI